MEAPGAYNLGLEHVVGEYVAFMLASSWYGEHVLEILAADDCTKQNMISFQPVYYGEDGSVRRPYSVLPDPEAVRDGMLCQDHIQLVLQAYLFDRRLLEGLCLRENLHEEAFVEMVLELQSRNDGIFLYQNESIYYYTVPLEDDGERSLLPGRKWWYTDSVKNFLFPFMKEKQLQYDGQVPPYIQKAVYYLICRKFECNLGKEEKLFPEKKELSEFLDLCCDTFTMMDNNILCQNGISEMEKLPASLRRLFLKEKAKKLGYHMKLSVSSEFLLCDYELPDEGQLIERTVIENITENGMEIRSADCLEGMFRIDGCVRIGEFFEPDQYEIYGEIVEGNQISRRIPAEFIDSGKVRSCFGVVYGKECRVHLEFPVKDLTGKGKKLQFYIKKDGRSGMLGPEYGSAERAYWHLDHNRYLMYREENSLRVVRSSPGRMLKRKVLFFIRRKIKSADDV